MNDSEVSTDAPLGLFSLVLKCLALCTRATAGFQWPGHLDGPQFSLHIRFAGKCALVNFFFRCERRQRVGPTTLYARALVSTCLHHFSIPLFSRFCVFFGFALIAVIVTYS